MGKFTTVLEDITIANNATDSRIVLANEFEDAETLILMPTGAIGGGGTISLQVTYDAVPSASGTWVTLQKAGADVVPLVAGKARAVSDDNNCVPACTGFRIHGTVAFTPAQIVKAVKTWRA